MKNKINDVGAAVMRAEIHRLNDKIKEMKELHFLDQSTIVRQRRQIEMLQEAAERGKT